MILNIITKNDPACLIALTSTKDCDQQTILLINEGVMLLQDENLVTDTNMSRVYFMEEDTEARGINKVVPHEATAVDYDHFVQLVAKHNSVVTW